MSAGPALPAQIRRALRPVLRLVGPVLDLPAAGDGRGGSPVVVCPAGPALVRRRVAASCAVYVAWDSHRVCRYVGSVCRQGAGAVGDRLAEHYGHPTAGLTRQEAWTLLTVLPLADQAALEVVRSAEGWTARLLNPMDGSAHPRIDLAQTPPSWSPGRPGRRSSRPPSVPKGTPRSCHRGPVGGPGGPRHPGPPIGRSTGTGIGPDHTGGRARPRSRSFTGVEKEASVFRARVILAGWPWDEGKGTEHGNTS